MSPPAPPTRRARRRRRFKLALLLVALPVAAEASAYGVGRLLQSRWAMYVDPVEVATDRKVRDYEEYLRVRDPELGWPAPRSLGTPQFDHDGSVPLPSNPGLAERGPPLISLYGDSFVWGQCNATPAQSWPDLLARRLERQVKNFGVASYGSDQAYLRFLRNTDDRTPLVVLGHMAENVIRNLTRLRDFTAGGSQGFAFKPRFVLGPDGSLERIPIPALTPTEYRRLLGLEGPALELAHESFAPGGPAGAVRLRFPFTLSVLRNAGYWRFRSRVMRRPDSLELYERDHPLHGYQITREVLRAFHTEAHARGRRPLVLLFPGPADAAYCQKTGINVLGPLAAELSAEGVEVLDFTPVLLRWLGERPSAQVFANSHFTAEVAPLIADTVAAWASGAGRARPLAGSAPGR